MTHSRLADSLGMEQPRPRPALRVVAEDETPAAVDRNAVWRPSNLDEMIGQTRSQLHVKMWVTSALRRNKQPGHILITGAHGLGKTSLSAIVAEMINDGRPESERVAFHSTTGDSVTTPQLMAETLCKLGEGDVLAIDEGHQIGLRAEEMLGLAMEDGRIMVPGTRSGSVAPEPRDIPKFTVVIGTTKPASLSAPLKGRLKLQIHMEWYDVPELARIVSMAVQRDGMTMTTEAATLIAGAGRQTPRLALNVYELVLAYTDTIGAATINLDTATEAFSELGIDSLGLDQRDQDYLAVVASFGGRRVGLTPLSSASGLDSAEITHDIAPYPIRVGLLDSNGHGRCLTRAAYAHLYPGKPVPPMLGMR